MATSLPIAPPEGFQLDTPELPTGFTPDAATPPEGFKLDVAPPAGFVSDAPPRGRLSQFQPPQPGEFLDERTAWKTPGGRFVDREPTKRENLVEQQADDKDMVTGDRAVGRLYVAPLDARAGLEKSLAGLIRMVPRWLPSIRQLIPDSVTDAISAKGESDAAKAKEYGDMIGGGAGGEKIQMLASTAIQSVPALLATPLGGLRAVSIAAGMQSGGQITDEAYQAYKARNDPNAEGKARLAGLISGAVTAGLTRAIPGGSEHFAEMLMKGELPQKAGESVVAAILKEIPLEWTEEALDQASQGIVAKYSYRPETTWDNVVDGAIEAGNAGAMLAGVTGAGSAVVGGVVKGVERGRLSRFAKQAEAERDASVVPTANRVADNAFSNFAGRMEQAIGMRSATATDQGQTMAGDGVAPIEYNVGADRQPIKVVSKIEDNGRVNAENLKLIADDMRDRFEQIKLQGRLTPSQDALLTTLRPLLDKPQPNQIENLSRFFGLTVDETATDMPERYRTVVHPTLSKPEQPSTKAPAPVVPGAPVKLYPPKGETQNAPATSTPVPATGPQPNAQTATVAAPAPTGEPVVLNGRAFSKVGDKWFDATSGKQRKVTKPGVVAQLEQILEAQTAAAAHPSTYDVMPDALQSDENEPVVMTKALPRDTRVVDPATSLPIEDTDVDPKTLKLSAEVPNFKSGAGDTGEVEGSELTGKYTRIGTGRTVVWERKDGTREVITGRHRWQLAKRTGVTEFPVQIIREADGFTREMAYVLDAESNIRDNQGSVKDFAHYFRSTPYDEKTAIDRGLLRAGADAKGRDGFNIGKYASDDLYALFMGGKIPERVASAIAKTAPNDANLQRFGIKAADDGKNIQQVVARMESAKRLVAGVPKKATQGGFEDILGGEEWKMLAEKAEREGDYVAAQRKALQDVIQTRRIVLAKPEAATSTGSIKAKTNRAKGEMEAATLELEQWQNWASDPDLRAKVEEATGGTVKESANKSDLVKQDQVNQDGKTGENLNLPKPDTGTTDMFGGTVAQKSPEQLAEEKRIQEQKLAIAQQQNKPLTGSVDTTMTLPGTEAAAGAGDIPLLTQPKRQGSYGNEPWSNQRVLNGRRIPNYFDSQFGDTVASMSSQESESVLDLAEQAFKGKSIVNWNAAKTALLNHWKALAPEEQIADRSSFNTLWDYVSSKSRSGSLATEPPQELATNLPLNAQGVAEMRAMMYNPAARLSQRVKDVVNAMLETPVMRKLDWNRLKVLLTDRIEGGFAGSAEIENDLIRLSRAADADTFPHEVFHFLFEMLPEKYKQAVHDTRVEAIDRALTDSSLTEDERKFLESLKGGEQIESDAFKRDSIRLSLYPLINDSEFLAGMAGKKFSTGVWQSRNASFMESFKERVVAWKNAVVDAVKRVIGVRPDMDQIFRELLAGRHVNRMAATIDKAVRVRGSLSETAEEARNAAQLAATQEARDVEATHTLAQSADIVDLLEKHGAGVATSKAARLLSYFDYAGIREVGRRLNNGVLENYRQLKARVTDPYKFTTMARPANTQIERFDVLLQDIQTRFAARVSELSSPSFLRLAMRESVAKANADAQGIALRNASAIISSALQKTQRVLNEERVNDRDLAQLEGQLREVHEAAASSTAMQQLLTDMVNVLSSTADGLQMLSDPSFGNRTAMLKLYRELKQVTGQPLHNESLLRWGTYILSKNSDVAEALLGAQFNSTSALRVAMDAYEHQLLADMEGDPVKTVKALLRERTKLVTDKDKAAFAWRQLHRELLEKLGNFDALEEANTVASSILADPDYKALRREIAKDSGTQGVNQAGKAPKVANAFSAGTIILPDGTEFDIQPLDLVGSKTRFQGIRQKYEAAKAVYEPWLANPANMDDPNYGLHQRNFEEITSYYLALGVMQPSDKNFVFKRSFNILQQVVRLAGGRVSAGAKKALGQLQFEQHQASAWTQRYTHLLSSAMQRALDSHAADLPEGGIHDKNTEYYRRHGNQLRASFNRQAGGLAVGDKTGSGWTVTPADMALVKLESDAVSEAFKILGNTQLTVDTLAGVTILRHALKGNPLMTTRSYTRDADLKVFVEQFTQAKEAHDAAATAQKPQHEAEMLRLMDAAWGRVGHSFLWDRSADFARATPFDGPGGAFQVLSTQMENNPGSVRNTADLFQKLSALSTLTPDEAKAVVLHEFSRIIGNVKREIVSDDAVQSGLRSEESKNSFTRSRNETVGPYAFYDNGFRNTNAAESFGQNIVSRSFDRVVTALQAVEADVDRQIQEFQTQVEQRVAQGVPISKARNQVQAQNAAERRNGETYDNYKYLGWTKKVVNDVTKLLQKNTDLSDDLTFSRYVGGLQGMLIGFIATFRNVARSPIKLGQLAMRLGSNPITAGVLAGYYGYVDTGAKMLASLSLSLLKTAYLIPKGIILTARDRAKFGTWWGKAMRPVVEEIGRTMYFRLKDIREAERRRELHIPDFVAQWDSTMAGLMMTQGRILNEEMAKGTVAVQKPMAWVEKYILSIQRMTMPMFGDTWANIAVNSAMESRFGVFKLWETQLRRLQNEFRGRVRFNFNNLQDPVNRISPKEMFNKRPWVADRAMLNIRNAFADVGMDFDEMAVKFIGQLEQGNANAEFLNESERSRLKSSQIDYANRASIVNQPLHLQQRNPLVTFFKPFMQWPTRMTSHLVDELSIPAALPRAARSALDAFKMRSVQVGVTMATLGLVAILSSITAAGDEEGNRALKKALFNQITGFKQPWERDNAAKGWAVYSMASVPFLEAVASIALSDTASRASLDPSLVVVEKTKDIIRYMGGAVQTGDWTYRLPELIGGLFPDAKIVLNRLESQEGKRELNNVVALARRHGPTELLRPTGSSSGGIQATELSPYADKMVAAAMNGDTAEVKRVYDEAVQVARDMGKADPEGSVRQMFEGRNPYTRVFRAQLTPEQRSQFLSNLSPTEQADVQNVEQRFAAGAEAIGATAAFQKTPRSIASGNRTGGSPSTTPGVQVPSFGASAGGGSRRLPRLSAVGAATVVRRPAGIRRRSPRLARGISRPRAAVRRIRGPRLSRFV